MRFRCVELPLRERGLEFGLRFVPRKQSRNFAEKTGNCSKSRSACQNSPKKVCSEQKKPLKSTSITGNLIPSKRIAARNEEPLSAQPKSSQVICGPRRDHGRPEGGRNPRELAGRRFRADGTNRSHHDRRRERRGRSPSKKLVPNYPVSSRVAG